MRQDIVDVFHHHVDVKIQHPVDRVRVGIDQVAADINTGIGVQDVELACLLQDLDISVAQLLALSRSMTSGITASPCFSRSAVSAASSRSTSTTRAPAASIDRSRTATPVRKTSKYYLETTTLNHEKSVRRQKQRFPRSDQCRRPV